MWGRWWLWWWSHAGKAPEILEKQTRDYVQHGTTTLFAALKVATGTVISACYPRHRVHQSLEAGRQSLPPVGTCIW
jgi:hypothetical protein